MTAKDFQMATANRIFELFTSQDNSVSRVLLADEVGLGKTIVAKAVVGKMGEWRRSNGGKDYVVVYICSNAGIANQNCAKLGIPKEQRVSISEGRLSMQHLVIEENKARSNVRLIPMTPATSFHMQTGVGTATERALAYIIMRESRLFKNYEQELSLFMRTYFVKKNENWNGWYVGPQNARINQLTNRNAYLKEMKRMIDETFSKTYLDQDKKVDLKKAVKDACKKIRKHYSDVQETADIEKLITWQSQKNIINQIRECFAGISLGMLKPDLVIMDEFQRFKDLIEIDANDESDNAKLSKKFLIDNTDTKVLLLSATPYKPFSTLAEFTDGEESHIKGFMRVIDFLVYKEDENVTFHKVWDTYTSHLSEIKGNNLSVLIASKNDAENELYNHICRTERRNSGIINVSKAKTIPIENLNPANINSYVEMQKIMKDFGIGNFPIDYVKSAPYLMSFMNYKVKDKIDKELRGTKKQITSEERARYISNMPFAFLNSNQINGYQELPNTNARLKTLFDEVFGHPENKNISPELLLWIPPANRYYRCGKDNIFEQCEGYSKTLIFSSWEMVPRVIATLTSYEAERLVVNRMKNKSVEQQSYGDVPDSDDMVEDESLNQSKRSKTRFLIQDQQYLVEYPSIWLADMYDCKEYYGWEISDIKDAIRVKIKESMDSIATNLNLTEGNMGAKQLLLLLKYMDASKLGVDIADVPDRIPNSGDLEVLINMAIGSPAVCIYRALNEIEDLNERQAISKECCTKSFVTMFNRPESRNIMAAIFDGSDGSSEEKHYEQAFHYCVDGNLQAMLDEYKYVLDLRGFDFAEALKESFLHTSNLPYVSQEYYEESFGDVGKKITPPKLRVHFAAGYFDAKNNDKTIQRVNNVRKAFNSPFRPFVLATTSVGQEGLDFHLYSRKVMHWNLPSNPIDLEQREGRINRYMCHAIRQNVAANESDFEWEEKFNKTKEKYGKDASDMIPYWCLPDNYEYKYQIERIVPMYPFSQDKIKYERIIDVLALYRLTLGQPRQEELIAILQREDLSKEQIEELFFDLSPYNKSKKLYKH